MPAYLVIHPREQRRDDLRLSGEDITLRFEAGWAIFSDRQGDCLAIPCSQGASIQRDDEPLPEGELADTAPALNK